MTVVWLKAQIGKQGDDDVEAILKRLHATPKNSVKNNVLDSIKVGHPVRRESTVGGENGGQETYLPSATFLSMVNEEKDQLEKNTGPRSLESSTRKASSGEFSKMIQDERDDVERVKNEALRKLEEEKVLLHTSNSSLEPARILRHASSSVVIGKMVQDERDDLERIKNQAMSELEAEKEKLLQELGKAKRRLSSKTTASQSLVKQDSIPAKASDETNDSRVNDETICNHCGQLVCALRLYAHEKYECLERVVQCRNPGCSKMVHFCDREWHEQEGCRFVQKRNKYLNAIVEKELHNGIICSACGEGLGTKANAVAKHKSLCKSRQISCPNHGCDKLVTQEKLEDHLESECKVAAKREELANRNWEALTVELKCPNCPEYVTKRSLKEHLANYCENRPIQCPLKCGVDQIAASKMSHHLTKRCKVYKRRVELINNRNKQKEIAVCPLGCKANLPQGIITFHCNNECPHRFIECKCGHFIHYQDKERHLRHELRYTIHLVPACDVSMKRAALAALSIARGRKPGLVMCKLCHEDVAGNKMKDHQETECTHRLVLCRFAGRRCSYKYPMAWCEMAEHLANDCPGARWNRARIEKGANQRGLVSCPLDCGETMSRQQVAAHTEVVCPNRPIPCKLCGVAVALNEMEKHISSGQCPRSARRDRMARAARERKKLGTPWKTVAKGNNFISYLKGLNEY